MRRVLLFVLVCSLFVGALVASNASDVEVQGRYVRINPLIGYTPRPIYKFLTSAEQQVIAQVERHLRSMKEADFSADAPVTWHIEPGTEHSDSYRLQLRVLNVLRRWLEGVDGFTRDKPVDIIVGRTQTFLQGEVAKLGCKPDLSPYGGQLLMGALLCNRRVIVSNLTGYLFLTRLGQLVTPAMEQRREPALQQTSFRIAVRNSSALTHEWLHYFRAAALNWRVAPDEPLWFSEGFAEFWSGMAMVREFPYPNALTRFHVTRNRDFFDWARRCPGPLSSYRDDKGTTCEYHLGALAMQLLTARYGGLDVIVEGFRKTSGVISFAQWFEESFGTKFEDFEREADAYINTIRRAELTK